MIERSEGSRFFGLMRRVVWRSETDVKREVDVNGW